MAASSELITLPRNKKLLEELTTKFPGADNLFKWFLAMNEIPRPSHHTQQIGAWLMEKSKLIPGTTAKIDKIGNICIHVPASPGKEHLPAIVLQAHTDMVPTTTIPGLDFTKHQLEMFLDGKNLRAKDTTLGADDGSGVAAILALAEDKTLSHAPIEMLFTIDEETGLEGAAALQEGELLSKNSKYLINVDSEEFGEICLSCAGAALRHIHVPLHRAPLPADWESARCVVSMLMGGHSGVDIHLGRANAIKWIVHMVADNASALAGTPYRIIAIRGGNAHNAVPSRCRLDFAVPAAKMAEFQKAMGAIFNALVARWKETEVKPPQLSFDHITRTSALSFSSTRSACRVLEAIHHGVLTWNEEVETLVETSQSLSVVKMKKEEKELFAVVFARSSHNTALKPVHDTLASIAAVYGGTCEVSGTDMAGWPAEPNSRLAKTAVSVFETAFKAKPKVTSIHAGLECGIIMGKFPGNKMEAISVGPTVRNPHTVDEILEVPSAVELYTYLLKLISALSQ